MDAHLPLRAGMSHSIRLESLYRAKVEPFFEARRAHGVKEL